MCEREHARASERLVSGIDQLDEVRSSSLTKGSENSQSSNPKGCVSTTYLDQSPSYCPECDRASRIPYSLDIATLENLKVVPLIAEMSRYPK